MSERLDNAEDIARVGEQIRLLIDAWQTPDALALADALEGGEVPVTHLRAYTYTEAGEADGDPALLEHGAAPWRSLDGKTLDSSYNLGNAELALFEISVRNDGRVVAFEQQRSHLHEARSCFAQMGAQESLRDDVQLQALTNLGNSYSQMGRDLEAIDCWRQAFDIDPDFAMAHANVGIALQCVAAFMGDHVPSAGSCTSTRPRSCASRARASMRRSECSSSRTKRARSAGSARPGSRSGCDARIEIGRTRFEVDQRETSAVPRGQIRVLD